jgi:hypothetical protein
MKVRRSVICFVVIILLLTMLTIWLGKKPAETPLSSAAETNIAERAVTKPTQPGIPIVATNVLATTAANTNVPNLSVQDKGEQIREGLAALNDVPIVFYGRLEDQFGSPVVGAEITGVTIIRNGTKSGAERISAISDGNGFFQLNAGKGESLGITPHKVGYVLATTDTSFDYSYMYADHFTPDPNNPTAIKMWKLQGAEPLMNINQRYKFHYTDAPMNFDLLAGKIVPVGGDIKITISRPPGIVSGRNRQDWSVQVEAVNGGLIESDGQEGVTFEAPENGYQLNDSFLMSTNPPDKWFGGFDQTFFLQSRNGQVYSKVNFGISINQNSDDYIWVEFHGVANTNSSRNWEAIVQQQ